MSVHANVITYAKPKAERNHPYLGVRTQNGGPFVVLFVRHQWGTVVAAAHYKQIGQHNYFDEDHFDIFDGKVELSNAKTPLD